MDYVNVIIEGLKSTSSSRVQESLHKIRSKVIVNDDGIKSFRECGGLEYLVPHLRKPNEKILDLTLSILGNCCLEEESSLLVGKLNSIAPLVIIVKTVSRDSIVGRACRVIGNLAQKNINAEGLHNHGAVTALVSIIENRDKNTSYPTLTMAVRAIRQLWMTTDKRDEMLSLNAVCCVANLLSSECELAGIVKSTNSSRETDGLRKSQEELINGILKCLGYFTTHATMHCAEQIQGDGKGYQCLVALTKTHETLALKCLMNLCYLSPCRPILGMAGLVECLVAILQKNSDVLLWPDGASRALSQLSGEAVNRSRLRHCGGLPLLVCAARVSSHAIHALLQYVFDDASFQILVNGGLVSFLTDELIKHLLSMEIQHSYELKSEMDQNSHSDKMTEHSVLKIDDKVSQKHDISSTNITVTEDDDDYKLSKKGDIVSRKTKTEHVSTISKDEDDLRVVIERDNMLVGFVDAIDSAGSNDSESEEENLPRRRKCLKRSRSKSPKLMKHKKPQFIRMASKDWSAGVYWEPKSPEWSSNAHHAFNIGLPESQLSPRSSIGSQSGFSPEYSAFSNKRSRWDCSPESGFSTGEGRSSSPHRSEYQWSPSSSGSPISHFSGHDESSDSEISGRYSPVCSEGEGEAEVGVSTLNLVGNACNNSVVEIAAAQVMQDLDELIMDDDNKEDTPVEDLTKTETNSVSSRIACILVLLFRVSHGACGDHRAERDEPSPSINQSLDVLANKECLNALLDYVERCKRPLGRAARVLAKVLSNALCLMSVLKYRLILRLYKMSVSPKHPPNKCLQCKQITKLSAKLLMQLTILAESSYGIGEISYQLLKGSSAMKQTLAMTLPYIVRSDKPLKKYFIECSALNILFAMIEEFKESMQVCVTALSKLATNVNIKDPKMLETRFRDQICIIYDPATDNLSESDVITFELDDSSIVNTNKIFLCQNSDVFSAMLMGCFKESNEKRVQLKNVTKPALEYLLTLLTYGMHNQTNDIQVFPMAEKLETNLEVLLLADRFLFDKLKILLNSAILQFQLKPDTADKIYVWSLNEGMGFLCVESVAYVLTGKMSDLERTQSFKTIFDLEYREQWLDDIKALILRQLVK